MKAVVAAFNQEKALVGAFSVITNLRMDLFEALLDNYLMVHILVSSYTASNPWLTDCDRSAANSWLLKIFRLQPGGI